VTVDGHARQATRYPSSRLVWTVTLVVASRLSWAKGSRGDGPEVP